MSTPAFPSCFDSRQQWLAWRASAINAHEWASICTDCTHGYRKRMQEQGRCDRDTARAAFFVSSTKTAKAPSITT